MTKKNLQMKVNNKIIVLKHMQKESLKVNVIYIL